MNTKNVTVDMIGIWQLAFEIFSGQREPIVAKAGEVSGGNEKRLTSVGPEQAQRFYWDDYNPDGTEKSRTFLGYEGIGPEAGVFVDKDHALEYALWRGLCGTQEDQAAFANELRTAAMNMYTGNWMEKWSVADE